MDIWVNIFKKVIRMKIQIYIVRSTKACGNV